MKSEFLNAFYSIFWMSYRKDIKIQPKIPKEFLYTSDSGWGCMVRSGQMLFSNAILRHMFGPDFMLSDLNENMEARTKYISILWEFLDNSYGQNAAFCISNMVEIGFRFGIKPKDWYGPSSVIQIFDELNEKYNPFRNLKTAAFPEGVLYKDELLFKGCGVVNPINPEKEWKNSIIIFVGFRLGLETIGSENFNAILRLMDNQYFTGMVGGQGKGALYFVGYQDKELIFLDPHVVQNAIGSVSELWTDHLTYHFNTPLRLPIEKLDTCVAYCIFPF